MPDYYDGAPLACLEHIALLTLSLRSHQTPDGPRDLAQEGQAAVVPDQEGVRRGPRPDLVKLLALQQSSGASIPNLGACGKLTPSTQSHPLRHSAEVLRAKSNQLLEFITDPTLSQRSLLATHMSSAALDARRAGSTRVGTPDEDADADAESDDDHVRHKRALSERLLNGINGDSESHESGCLDIELISHAQPLATRLLRLRRRALPRPVSLAVSVGNSARDL